MQAIVLAATDSGDAHGRYQDTLRAAPSPTISNHDLALAHFFAERTQFERDERDCTWLTRRSRMVDEDSLPEGAVPDSIAACTRLIEAEPLPIHTLLKARIGRGKAYVVKRMLDEAISDFTEAIRLNPEALEAYGERGLAFLGKKEELRARIDFDAIKCPPHSPDGARLSKVVLVYSRPGYGAATNELNCQYEDHSAWVTGAFSPRCSFAYKHTEVDKKEVVRGPDGGSTNNVCRTKGSTDTKCQITCR